MHCINSIPPICSPQTPNQSVIAYEFMSLVQFGLLGATSWWHGGWHSALKLWFPSSGGEKKTTCRLNSVNWTKLKLTIWIKVSMDSINVSVGVALWLTRPSPKDQQDVAPGAQPSGQRRISTLDIRSFSSLFHCVHTQTDITAVDDWLCLSVCGGGVRD